MPESTVVDLNGVEGKVSLERATTMAQDIKDLMQEDQRLNVLKMQMKKTESGRNDPDQIKNVLNQAENAEEHNAIADEINRIADMSEAERYARRDAAHFVWVETDETSGRPEFLTFRFLQACFAEYFGMAFFVMFGGLSVIGGRGSAPFVVGTYIKQVSASDITNIALGYGIGLACAIYCTLDISGANLNPVVSLSLCMRGKISLAKSLAYIAFQLCGSLTGAGILSACIPSQYQGTLGSTTVAPELGLGAAVALEGMMTAFLVFAVLSITYPESNNRLSAPIMIGLVVFVDNVGGAVWTGASMNPARSFGPAAVSGTWENHWVYWVGPLWGSVFITIFYDIVFANVFQIDRVKKVKAE